jgi:hypothetical protein
LPKLQPKFQWYKGNIHTHSTESDGDSSPETVVRWYRRHQYDFLVLSDHNHLTLLDYGNRRWRFRRPLMIPGEEVSVGLRFPNGRKGVHLGAIGISHMVEPVDATEVVPTLQANINAILAAGGIACINHPNYTWAFDHREIRQVAGAALLEVFNGHPGVNVHGAPGKFSYEEIWDGVLTAGRPIFGVATDDAHNFKDFTPKVSNPGRGWVAVWAEELSLEGIVAALASGEFYASTGVTLARLDTSGGRISLSVEPHRDFIYTISIIGPGGRVLAQVVGTEADYAIRGDEGYVRATVTSSRGSKAWTQPVFTSAQTPLPPLRD